MQQGGLGPHQPEEPDVVVGADRAEHVQREVDLRRAPHPPVQRLHLPQRVAVVHVHQDLVGPELGLVRADDVLVPEVLVHVLQRLQALGEVLVVQLPVEIVAVLLDEALGADDVETGALLDDPDRGQVCELLLGDVLPEAASGAPNELEPLADVLAVAADRRGNPALDKGIVVLVDRRLGILNPGIGKSIYRNLGKAIH